MVNQGISHKNIIHDNFLQELLTMILQEMNFKTFEWLALIMVNI